MTTAREITATQFKAHVLRLLDEVAESGQPIVITKHGKAVARLEATAPRRDLRGSAKLHLSDEELVTSSMGAWDIERE
jgi:prevent-host-death family protein